MSIHTNQIVDNGQVDQMDCSNDHVSIQSPKISNKKRKNKEDEEDKYFSIDITSIKQHRECFLVSEGEFQKNAGKIAVKHILERLRGWDMDESITFSTWVKYGELDLPVVNRENIEKWLNEEINSQPKNHDVPLQLDEDTLIYVWSLRRPT